MKKKHSNKNSKKHSNKVKKSRLLLNIIIAVFSLVFFVFCYFMFIHSSVRSNSDFKLDSGASVGLVAKKMKENGNILSQDMLKFAIICFGGRIQAGDYEFKSGTTTWQIAKKIARGDIASTTIVIPEGLTVKQIKIILLENNSLIGDFDCKSYATKTDVCDLKEGDLFPDTYRVARGTHRIAVLELLKVKMDSIRVGWENSGKSMPSPLKSWDDVITLASIIQKETPTVSEMPTVASVYLNRLKKNMKLQADPTVVYAITDGLGDMKGRGLFIKNLKTVSPYNTYTNYGLPPAPIANVGQDAIKAVLNPADTNYLFFVADGNGGHKFANSYAEHQKNHMIWRDIKKAKNPKVFDK